jgi:S1-C subfamily serine protease
MLVLIFLSVIAFLLGRISSQSFYNKPEVKQQNSSVVKKPIVNFNLPFTRTARTVSEIAEEGGKSTVYIVTRSKIGLELGSGSGFIISSDGKIVTNFHVIENAAFASVKLANGDVYDDVSVVSYDERRDIAILKVKGLKLPTSMLGDSDVVKVGEKVVAIGNPLGLEKTVSEGIISSIRNMEGVNVLQTTAPISHGSSGGALFNSKGEIVGITFAGFEQGQNLNFAIPINYAKPLIDQSSEIELSKFQDEFTKKKWIGGKFDIAKKNPFSKEKEEKQHPYFGWVFAPTKDSKRLKIVYLRTYSPARDSGIKVGDEIIEINGHKTEEKNPLIIKKNVDELQPEKDVPIKLLRKNTEMTLNIKLGSRPKPVTINEAIEYELFDDRPVRLAIFVDEINFIGPNADMQDWKRSIRSSVLNEYQSRLKYLTNNKNFSIIDTGKIDVILNDLENKYGSMPPQVRDSVLQSLGITHLVSITFSRYANSQFYPYVRWKTNLEDNTIAKIMDVRNNEVVCSETMQSKTGWDGKLKPFETTDPQLQDYINGLKALNKEFEAREKG